MGRWGAAGLLAVALVAGAAGCGGDGPDDEGDTPGVEDPGTAPPEERPGAPDSGEGADGGTGDGGETSDGGRDGGGGTTDGGTPDSGTGGGGGTDGGTPDSGTGGGGSSDGGTPDSGTGGGGGAASTSFERVFGDNPGEDVGSSVVIARDGDLLLASTHALRLPDFGEGRQPERGNAALSRFTPNGKHLWTYSEVFVGSCDNGMPCGLSDLGATAAAVDAAGRSALGTLSYEEGRFDPFSVRQTPRITVLGRNGKVLWTRAIQGPGGEAGLSDLGFDAAGNLYASGFIRGPGWDFGDGQPRGTEFLPAVYVASYTPGGVLRWVKLFGDARGSSRGGVMAMDPAGGFVLVGEMTGRLSFGGEELVGNEDGKLPDRETYVEPRIFVARFGPDGAHRWSRLFAVGHPRVYDVSVGPGGVALAGWFGGSFTFAGRTLQPRQGVGGAQDGFVAVMGADGQERWVVTVSSVDTDGVYGVAWGPGGDVWAAGSAGDGAMVGTTPVPGERQGGLGSVLARLRGDSGEVVSVAAPGARAPGLRSLAVDARGVVATSGSVPGGTTCDEGCGRALELYLMQQVP